MTTLASTLPASKARANFYQILEEATKYLRRFVITHRGSAQAVIMPLEELESWEETLEIMSDKRLMKAIRQGEKDIKASRTTPLRKIAKELGLDED